MVNKRLIIVFATTSILLLGFAFWWGGSSRWEISGIDPDSSGDASILKEFEEKIKEESDLVVIKYNLAYFYYQQQKYAEARDVLKELLHSKESDNHLIKKTLYNLGNNLFRLAENEKDLSKALTLLGESLEYYRTVIEKEKQEKKYSMKEIEGDDDAHFNYAVVRRRIKILADKLAQQEQKEAQQKKLYQLLKELAENEENIQQQLISMKNDPYSKETLDRRNDLLEQRQENLKKLNVIRERIMEMVNPSKGPAVPPKPPSSSATI